MKKSYKVILFIGALPFFGLSGLFLLVTFMFGPGAWTLDSRVDERREFFDGQPESFFSDLAADLIILMDAVSGREQRYSKCRRDLPIPERLSHLDPQSVVVRRNSVSIILEKMMDTGAILNADRYDGAITIVGSFGDYGHPTLVQRTYYQTPSPNPVPGTD